MFYATDNVSTTETAATLVTYIITKTRASRGTSDTNIDLAGIPLEEASEKFRLIAFSKYEDRSLW